MNETLLSYGLTTQLCSGSPPFSSLNWLLDLKGSANPSQWFAIAFLKLLYLVQNFNRFAVCPQETKALSYKTRHENNKQAMTSKGTGSGQQEWVQEWDKREVTWYMIQKRCAATSEIRFGAQDIGMPFVHFFLDNSIHRSKNLHIWGY